MCTLFQMLFLWGSTQAPKRGYAYGAPFRHGSLFHAFPVLFLLPLLKMGRSDEPAQFLIHLFQRGDTRPQERVFLAQERILFAL